MAIHLPDARQLPDPVLQALRLRALRACERGHTHAEVAEILGVSRGTVTRWWDAYQAGGVGALPGDRTGRPRGSGAALDKDQAARIQALLDDYGPEELGIAAPLWTRRAVRQLIRDEFGIALALRTVGAYLARWGYTAKRPTRRSKLQDPQEVAAWIEETYPEIEEQAREEDADIFWADETGVQADHHPHTGYARRGAPAVLGVPKPHLRINVAVALSNTGELHYQTYDRSLTGAAFVAYLAGLLAATRRKVLLIIDRHPAHTSGLVERWLEAHADRIEVHYLPPHAPEINAEEYVNQDLKSNVHAERLPDTKSELLGQVQAFLLKLQSLPKRVMAYFQHPKVRFAA
jgi:transposase